MSTKSARGTKRTCQSNECGSRFYDLNNDPIACPICGTIYVIASSPLPIETSSQPDKILKKVKKPEIVAEKILPEDVAQPEIEGEDVLVEIEEAVDIPADETETFLEEEEEEGGGDVTNIIGGPVAEGEEES